MKKRKQRSKRISFWLHILRLLGFAAGLSVLLLFFTLLTAGLPDSITHTIRRHLLQRGVPLQFDSIHLTLHRGWVLSNVELYSSSPDNLRPLLQTPKLYLWAWPKDWRRSAKADWFIKLYARNMQVSFGRHWEENLPQHNPFQTLKTFKAAFTAGPKHILVDRVSADWGGVQVTLRGTLIPRPSGSAERTLPDLTQIPALASRLAQIEFNEPPELYIDFNLDSARPADCTVDAILSARGLRDRGRIVEELAGELRYRVHNLRVSGLIRQSPADEALVLSGQFDADRQIASLSVSNSLPAPDLLGLLPQSASDVLTRADIDLPGRLDFSAAVGPAPLNELQQLIRADVRNAHIIRNDLTLNPVSGRIAVEGTRLTVSNITALANGGPLSGKIEIDLSSRAWKTHLRGQCNPAPIGTIAGGKLQNFLNRFRFPDEQPNLDLTVSQARAGAGLIVKGDLSASRFVCSGVPIGTLETSMVYSNRTLNLSPLDIVRAKERLQGRVQVDFAEKLSRFAVTNSFPPNDITQVLAPGKKTPADLFGFAGPVYFTGGGTYDYGQNTRHDLRGSFRGEQIDFDQLLFTLFTTDVQLEESRLILTNSSAKLFGGFAEGGAGFDLHTADADGPYWIDADFSQLNVQTLAARFSTNKTDKTKGVLSGSLRLAADAKEGFWNSVRGTGHAEIRDGRLASVPLFGGFSRLVQSVFPAFSLFSLTSFDADFELRNGAVYSSNAQVGGTLLSARGSGRWSPERGLFFNVKAQPLGKSRENKAWYDLPGWASDLIKKGTSPFFYFLEFELKGPLGKPEWSFKNLPSEVSEMLGGTN